MMQKPKRKKKRKWKFNAEGVREGTSTAKESWSIYELKHK